jgi:hypothetical protein
MTRALLAAALLLLPCLAEGASARFALVVANSQGAEGQATLAFAERDAERMATALAELGGFERDDIHIVRRASAASVRAELLGIEARVAAARRQGVAGTLFVFYYSGHADAEGLELADDERFGFDELRERIRKSIAEVKVAIVDACHSGSFTRVKGGKPVKAARLLLPPDAVRGVAFVASSALGEPAQESSALEGSFFTHHFESALRGAADFDGDGRVSLAEAFRYTSEQTVRGTARTAAGPQHPTYEMQMSGRGEVILADLRRAEAKLVLPSAERARFLIRGAHGLFAEVAGGSAPVLLGLPSGSYQVERRVNEARATAEVVLEKGGLTPLPPMTEQIAERGRSKGGRSGPELFASLGWGTLSAPDVHGALVPRIGGSFGLGPGLRLRISAQAAQAQSANGELGYSAQSIGVATALLFSRRWGAWRLDAGPEAAMALVRQTERDGQRHLASLPAATATVAFGRSLGPLWLGVEAAAGGVAFRLNGASTVRATWRASFFTGWKL